ncbi:MAG: 50S ribosomal protein L4 [Hydrogenophilus sp.]|nr:50S ribosomal protein L4 [Hydrogenophilus sp.]
MELKRLDANGTVIGSFEAPDPLFAREFNEALVHQVVVAYMANARRGTRAQKSRAQVKHSTRKPWRQKGTGRARAGMTSSPLWRKGGKVFPSTPEENFSQKVNRKMYRAAMAAILSELVRQERLAVIDPLEIPAPKTKWVVEKLKALGVTNERVLLVDEALSENLVLGSRNLPNVEAVAAHQVDPVSLIYADRVLVTPQAIAKFQEMWQ